MANKILSVQINGDSMVLYILGVRISLGIISRPIYRAAQRRIQNKYDLAAIKNAQKTVVFLIPPINEVNGGLMSIFNLCAVSRQICRDAAVLIATIPGKTTYARNTKFRNNEKIYRWEQIINNATTCNDIIIHIPEYLADKFYGMLSNRDKAVLNRVTNLHINIMNQNMWIMPAPEKISDLWNLTTNITQTLAFDKNLIQELSDTYNMPVHLFSTLLDYSAYKPTEFANKEKIIVLSPDDNPNRRAVIDALRTNLPDFKLITVKNMTFDEYMDLISRAFAVITFGEGFDGYFAQPSFLKTISFSVFNETFFPDKTWLNVDTVFESYAEMTKQISNKIRRAQNDKDLYYAWADAVHTNVIRYYSYEQYVDNLTRFYNHLYDITPSNGMC